VLDEASDTVTGYYNKWKFDRAFLVLPAAAQQGRLEACPTKHVLDGAIA
jgi:hypothetical protein